MRSLAWGTKKTGLTWKEKQQNAAPKPAKPKARIVAARPPASNRVRCTWCHGMHGPDSEILRRCMEEQKAMSGTIDPQAFTHGMTLPGVVQ